LLSSVVFHCLMLAGFGWLGGMLFTAAHPQEYIEMELVSTVAGPERVAKTGSPPAAAPAKVRPALQPVRSAVAEQPATATEVSADAVAESIAAQPVSAAAGSGRPSAAGAAAAANVPAGGKTIAAPRLLQKKEPGYPEDARRAGVEGTVALRIEIKEDGQPGEIAVVRSSGLASLDAAAMEAVRSWRFVPAQEAESGRPVRCYTTVSIVFRLNT
jgi:protein TonB